MSLGNFARGAALAGLLAGAGLVAGCGGKTPRNVLLITLDTLRADRVGSLRLQERADAGARRPGRAGRTIRGGDHDDSPDAVGAHQPLHRHVADDARGARQHRVLRRRQRQTLAETLKARGYRTGGFVGAFVLDARWGIAQGFDTYFDEFDLSEDVGPGLDAIQRPGGEVVDAALEWLGQPREQPFFALGAPLRSAHAV